MTLTMLIFAASSFIIYFIISFVDVGNYIISSRSLVLIPLNLRINLGFNKDSLHKFLDEAGEHVWCLLSNYKFKSSYIIGTS